LDIGGGSSSALNQALSSSAQNLTTDLYGQFAQQQNAGQNQAMTQMLSLIQNPQFEAIIHQNPGIIGPLLAALGKIGASAVAGGIG